MSKGFCPSRLPVFYDCDGVVSVSERDGFDRYVWRVRSHIDNKRTNLMLLSEGSITALKFGFVIGSDRFYKEFY